jgi:hypothetical protein
MQATWSVRPTWARCNLSLGRERFKMSSTTGLTAFNAPMIAGQFTLRKHSLLQRLATSGQPWELRGDLGKTASPGKPRNGNLAARCVSRSLRPRGGCR